MSLGIRRADRSSGNYVCMSSYDCPGVLYQPIRNYLRANTGIIIGSSYGFADLFRI